MPEGDAATQTFSQDDVDAAIAEANAGLEANRDEILGELKGLRDQLKAFDGIDPKANRAMKKQITELEQAAKATKAGITSEELETMRGEVRVDLEHEYEPLQKQVDVLSAENRTLKLDNVVKGLMGSNGVRAERVDALFRLTADQFDLTSDDKPMLRNHKGKDVGKFIADELATQWPEFYQRAGSSGGGAPKSVSSGSGSVKEIQRDDMDGFMDNLDAIVKGDVEVVS